MRWRKENDMNYWIQGDAANADKIRAAFERLGYDTSFVQKLSASDSHILFTLPCDTRVHAFHTAYIEADILKRLVNIDPDYQELELPIEFKDGDIIGFNDCTHNDGSYIDWVGIYRHQSNDFINHQHFFHCVATSKNTFRIGGSWRVFTAYPATKEQRDLLFRKMKEAGYQWDADKKELRKIQPHYDIANFKPFDKVLVRDSDKYTWSAELFSFYRTKHSYPFRCIGNAYSQCIPYEGNEHLLGTIDPCDEQYINW